MPADALRIAVAGPQLAGFGHVESERALGMLRHSMSCLNANWRSHRALLSLPCAAPAEPSPSCPCLFPPVKRPMRALGVVAVKSWTQAAPRWALQCGVHNPAAAAAAARRRLAPAAAATAYSSDSSSSGGGKTALVQGSSRGIGLEFAAQLLERPTTAHLIATCRDPAASTGLQELQARHGGRLTVLAVDTSDEGSIAAAAAAVAAAHTHLDLLINASGILHDAATGLAPETALSRVTMASLLQNFQVNAAGHILTLKAFAPLLAAAQQQNGATQ